MEKKRKKRETAMQHIEVYITHSKVIIHSEIATLFELPLYSRIYIMQRNTRVYFVKQKVTCTIYFVCCTFLMRCFMKIFIKDKRQVL